MEYILILFFYIVHGLHKGTKFFTSIGDRFIISHHPIARFCHGSGIGGLINGKFELWTSSAVYYRKYSSSRLTELTLGTPARFIVNQNGGSNSNLHKVAAGKDLVLWGSNLGSMLGVGRLTKVERYMIKLAPLQFSVIIGLLLSDGWLTLSSEKSLNARLGFKQSLNQSIYVYFVFNLLSHYCSSAPCLTSSVRNGKINYGVQIFTRSLPCFTELHSLFYIQKIKVIPVNIYDLLTPVALAHLIMGDGEARQSGLVLCTNSFSVQDVVRLMNVLIVRYGLDCILRLKKQNNKIEYLIYIRQGSMPLLRSLVAPYFHPSMYYKINLVV